jgi:hypothetical protein
MHKHTEQTFSKKKVQMVKKHRKKCSSSLIINEIQIQTTLRFYLLPVRMLSSGTQVTTNVGEEVRIKESSYTVGRNVNENN